MTCPYCAGSMQTHRFVGRLGKKIIIKKCENCDGFWLKSFDLFDLPIEDCKDLDNSIYHHNNYQKQISCPKCNKNLTDFTHYNLPKDLHFKHCENCGGVWAYPGKIFEFKQRDLNGKKKSASISAQTRMVMTVTFCLIFAVFSWANLSTLSGESLYSAYDGSIDGLTNTNLNIAIQGIILLLLVGTLMILWGKFRKVGWILNFTALFLIIFYVMLKIVALLSLNIIR